MRHADITDFLRKAAEGEMNVLLEGTHGTGKTSLICQVADEMGLQLKYFSTATLDPFVDLVGLPVPKTDEKGRPSIVYHRQTEISDAELLFFDELNRAQPKTLNAVLEIIQFRTINGEPLPKLKAVFAACNPVSKEYNVVELDAALLDRFHMHITVEPGPDAAWFRKQLGRDLGNALCDWYDTDLDPGQQAMVSPRRLEYIGKLISGGIDPARVTQDKGKLPFRQLQQRVKASNPGIETKDIVDNPSLYARKVAEEMSTAIRVAHLITRMRPAQMATARDVTLSLPAEILATIKSECPFVFKKTDKATKDKYGAEEAEVFRMLLEERLGECESDTDTSKQAAVKAA